MPTSIRICHLNIERSKHLEQIVPFLTAGQFDVVCMQELVEADIPHLEVAIGGTCFFVPMGHRGGVVDGIGIFSKLPMVNTVAQRYGGSQEMLPEFVPGPFLEIDGPAYRKAQHDLVRFSLALCEVQKDGKVFRIATTHFPVTVKGQTTDYQREDMHTLLGLLEAHGELVVTGDFNAPRGGEIFSLLAGQYKDNVPLQYKTSLDSGLHRGAKTDPARIAALMVDGIFSTGSYVVSDVQMHQGLSDHCALTATVILTG